MIIGKYIAVKGTIDILPAVANRNDKAEKDAALKNNAPWISKLCISKINNTLVDIAEDFDMVMSVHNLLEYSDNYSITRRKFMELL